MSQKKIKIAAVQMRSTDSASENLTAILEIINQAAKKKVQLIAFPENCLLMGYGQKSLFENKDFIEHHALLEIKKYAKKNNIAVLLGGVCAYHPASKKFHNRIYFFNEKGVLLGTYNKIHLFDSDVKGDQPYRESNYFTAGKKTVVLKWNEVKLGLSICYDLRFPELYRKLLDRGAQILFAPAAFTVPTGQAHWDILTRARAIENLSFLIAPAQEGKHKNNRKTYGHTRIINPWGEVQKEIKKGVGMIISEIDLMDLKNIRKGFPSTSHRKL